MNIYKNKTMMTIVLSVFASIMPQLFFKNGFLLMLATGAWPVTMGLLEKNVLQFSADTIVHMGTMLFIGSMVGFYIGGKLVDRLGTKVVFLGLIPSVVKTRKAQWLPHSPKTL